MATAEVEDWWRLIEIAAKVVLGLPEQPRTRSSAEESTIPPHWSDPAFLKLVRENRRLSEENAELGALRGDFVRLLTELSEFGPSVEEILENIRHIVSSATRLLGEHETLKRSSERAVEELEAAKQSAARSAEELAVAQREKALLSGRLEVLERDLALARDGAIQVLRPDWLADFRLLLHPKMLHHVQDLVMSSAESAMGKSIESILQSILRATALGTLALEGSPQQVMDGLEKSGLLKLDKYSRRTLSWLTRRTPVVVARAGAEGSIYKIHLDWFIRPPQACLDHFRVSTER